MRDLFDLSGKTAIVTGATRGIGRAIAHALAAHGAKVAVSSRKQDACDQVAGEIIEAGGEAIPVACNISYREHLETLVAKTREAWGRVDVVVANAAVNPYYGSNLKIPEDAFQKTMTCNVRSNLWLAELVVPEMRERRDGSFIIVSSIGGYKGSAIIGAYCITKAADMQIVRNLSVELSRHNIRFNCIAPGLVKTYFAQALYDTEEKERARIEATPLRRLGEPEDIAGAAVFLASKAGRWITGQTIVVDGGVMVQGG
jgi:NAD(P)-dependent dehydrogenase (short-subunit alcohol dehydrogenase family)